jgi:inosose dehydratase
MSRVASAPISWGICEVPGWGAMLPTPRVLAEMSGLGLPATELGAPGFLPDAPEQVQAELAKFDMSLIGGFTPLVLQDPAQREATIAEARRVAALFERAGATKFITAAVVDMDWSEPSALSAEQVRHMAMMFSIVDEICAEHGLDQVLHPHVMTTVENDDDVNRVLDSCDVRWCLDTGHLAIGGTDPVQFAKDAFDRVGHVHLKDVNLSRVPALMRREVSIMESVQQGLFTPLGHGDVDIAGEITALESSGYNGLSVIEQDTAITDGLPAEGAGPVTEVITSLDFLRTVVDPQLASA